MLVVQSPNNFRAIGRDQPDGVEVSPSETFNNEMEDETTDLATVTFEDMEDVALPPMDEIMSEDSDDEYVPGVRPKPKRSVRIKELPKKRGKKDLLVSSAVAKKPVARGRKKKKSESEDEFSG